MNELIAGLAIGGTFGFAAGVTVLFRQATRIVDRRGQRLVDHGFLNGLAAATKVARDLPKPYITMTQEQGWDLAHRQHIEALTARVQAETTALTGPTAEDAHA